MGKKYLETKNKSLESSVLGVWKTAVEEGAGRMDGRTAEYREHRKKLESARQRRESKKVNKEEVEVDEQLDKKLKETGLEASPNPANKQHLCAKNVVHEEWGKGKTVNTMHADPDEDGNIAWYDVMFEHGIEKEVSVDVLEVTEAKMHAHYDPSKKKKKKEEDVEIDEAAVNPKEREELDKAPSDTAKKIKKAKEPEPGQMAEAQSGGKEEYQKFFNSALKKFKVNSPAELKGDDKKKFYDYIDKNWEGDNEKAEGAMSQVREFKIQNMKAALAQVWGMEEGKNPFENKDKTEKDEGNAFGKALMAAKEKGEKTFVVSGKKYIVKEADKVNKTETGKKAAVIDLKPKIKDA